MYAIQDVWSVASLPGQATLGRNEFYVVMRLVALAQSGETTLTRQRVRQTATKSIPVATFKGAPQPSIKNSTGKKSLPAQAKPNVAPAKDTVAAKGASNSKKVKGVAGDVKVQDKDSTLKKTEKPNFSNKRQAVKGQGHTRVKPTRPTGYKSETAKRPRPDSNSTDGLSSSSSAASSDVDPDEGSRSGGNETDDSSRAGNNISKSNDYAEGRKDSESDGSVSESTLASGGRHGVRKTSGVKKNNVKHGRDTDSASDESGSGSDSNGGSPDGSQAAELASIVGEDKEGFSSAGGGSKSVTSARSSSSPSSSSNSKEPSMAEEGEEEEAEATEGPDAFTMTEKARAKYQVTRFLIFCVSLPVVTRQGAPLFANLEVTAPI